MITRNDTVAFAFIIIKSRQDEFRDIYWLHGNLHLNGASFFGGHIDPGEHPAQAAIRELLEETGDDELTERWQVNTTTLPTIPLDKARLESKLIALNADSPLVLPFYSYRYRKERLASCYFFELDIDDVDFHPLRQRIIYLKDRTHPQNSDLHYARPFTLDELRSEGWNNPINPFIRAYLKTFHSPCHVANYKLDFADLETCIEASLRGIIGFDDIALSASLLPPGEADIADAFRYGGPLRMRLEIRASFSEEIFTADLPYPHLGVFVLESSRPSVCRPSPFWIWHPALIDRPGYWAIRVHRSNGEIQHVIRVGSDDSRSLTAPITKSKRARRKLSDRWTCMTPEISGNINLDVDLFPPPRQQLSAPKLLEGLQRLGEAIDQAPESIDWLDDQDIAHQRLFTYSAHLLSVFNRVAGSVRSQQPERYWQALCRLQTRYEYEAFQTNRLRSEGRLHYFDPINAVDALARLTSFSKYMYPGRVMERLPAINRQLHPSWKGFVCPFQSPESKRVGLTLNLARGVKVSACGTLHMELQASASDLSLGHAADLVPYICHNDAPRAMMGAKNMRQAVWIQGNEAPLVTTSGMAYMAAETSPYSDLGFFPRALHPAPGRNLLIAYMPYEGYNFEDGIVVNEALKESGVLDWIQEATEEILVRPGWQLCPPSGFAETPERLRTVFFDEKGLRKPGSRLLPVQDGVAVACLENIGSGQKEFLRLSLEQEATLTAIAYQPAHIAGACSRILLSLRFKRALAIGDKLTGRHGNKGVIATFISPENMPRLPDDERLPESLRGRAVDLLLNPNGVISRMNIGQLIETQATFAMLLKNRVFTGTQRLSEYDRAELQQSFTTGCDDNPIDAYGRVHLFLPTKNKYTRMPVTVGMQFFCRLKHFPGDKAQIRGEPSNAAAYSQITGQPVAGRRRGGGQRIGEMEMWALAAHRADRSLDSVLTKKSDYRMILNEQTRSATFKSITDHLHAAGYRMEQQEGTLKVSDTPVCEQASRLVTTHAQVRVRLQMTASCPECKQPFVVMGEESQRGNFKTSVEGILPEHTELRHALNEALTKHQLQGPFKLVNLELPAVDGRSIIEVLLSMPGSKVFKGVVRVDSQSFHFKGRLDTGILDARKLLGASLCCPDHPEKILDINRDAIVPIQEPVPGGLFDPALFGASGQQFAYMEIPSVDDQTQNIMWKQMPVLPFCYRRPKQLLSIRGLAEDELTSCYAGIMLQSQQIRKLQMRHALRNLSGTDYSEQLRFAQSVLEAHQSSLDELLARRLKGKFGLLRRYGLGRRVNFSGRFVIVPGPELAWDECGLPGLALGILLGKAIAGWQGLQILEELPTDLKAPDYWLALNEHGILVPDEMELRYIAIVVDIYLRAHPLVRLVLNRAPTLHKYNIMAFRPKLLTCAGDVLRIHPLVCAGFGADFDGDEISVHLPFDIAEHKEADRRLSPLARHNLLSVANHRPVAGFSQDMILGAYLASADALSRHRILDLFEHDCCRDILTREERWDKRVCMALLQHLCEEHESEVARSVVSWMSACFEIATEWGCSFGYLELLEYAVQYQPEQLYENDTLNKEVSALLAGLVTPSPSLENPAMGFASIACSGARGGPEQIRQILLSRGFLDPGTLAHTAESGKEKDFQIRGSLIYGMTADEAFRAAFNGRSSMIDKKLGTPVAGSITRNLVLAAWPWHIRQGQCDSSSVRGHVLDCGWLEKHVVCAHCYGDVDDSMPAHGYPCGLIAAQSFGERGTQLSMQSFHTGKKAITLSALSAFVNEVHRYSEFSDFHQGIQDFGVYNALDVRHLKLIWLALRHQKQELDTLLVGRWQRIPDSPRSAAAVYQQALFDSPLLQLLTNHLPGPYREIEENS